MEPYEYQTLFEFESFYWWYKALHLVLLDTLESLGLPLDTRILDAGCGTGQNLANIVEHITANVYGFDLSEHAVAFWSKRNLERMCVASINEIPFASKTFQAVVSIDVMECEQVNEAKAYSELWRVLKPGGYMLLVVPAYDWLIDKEHHRAVRAVRRYSKSKLLSLLSTRPTELMRITHLFGSVLPAVACRRFASKLFSGDGVDPPRSDLKPFNPVLNHLLFKLVSMERRLVRMFDIPFGSSIMAVARKIGE